MKTYPILALIALVCLFTGVSALRAEAPKPPPKLYAQVLVDWVMASHPELEHFTLHAIYPGRQVYTSGIIGVDDKGGEAGSEDDADDYLVLTTGKGNFAHYQKKNKDLWKAELPLLDRNDQVIGELTLRQQYTTKEDEAKFTKSFIKIRNHLKVRIPSQESLYDTGRTAAKSYAQSLIDYTMATHQGIEHISLHAFAPGAALMTDCNIASDNPDKVGDADDAEDFLVQTTGKAHIYQTEDKALFKGLLPVNDAAGRQLGMLLVRYKYTTKEDEPKLQRQMEDIRNWLQLHIPSKTALYEPVAE